MAWANAIERRNGPSALALSRQNLAPNAHPETHLTDARRGGYVLWESAAAPELILIATGSEVELAMAAGQRLAEQGRAVRVVSMPCADLFLEQDAAYRNRVLPFAVRKRIAVEAGVTHYWRAFVGLDGDVVGVDRFGESAPAAQVFQYLGVTVDAIVEKAQRLLTVP